MRQLVNDYLTFVNYLPGATVVGGDPSGHGEGAARGKIREFEYVYALSQRQPEVDSEGTAQTEAEAPLLTAALESARQLVKAAAKAKFDKKQCASLITQLIEDQWAMFAAETPDVLFL